MPYAKPFNPATYEPLRDLHAAEADRRDALTRIRRAAVAVLRAGGSYADVAEVLGISAQAAHQRFKPVLDGVLAFEADVARGEELARRREKAARRRAAKT